MRRLIFGTWLGMLLLTLGFTVAFADHLPEKLMATGKPEDTLAGIDFQTTTLPQVLAIYGPPTRKITVPNNPVWTGYVWQLAGRRVEVGVSRGVGKKDYLGSVAVVQTGAEEAAPSTSGPSTAATVSPARADSTGSGLKLGDSLDRLKSLYGDRFQLSKQSNSPAQAQQPFLAIPGTQTATVQWMPVDFTLMVGLDAQGKIIAMRLQPPSCYPGGCK